METLLLNAILVAIWEYLVPPPPLISVPLDGGWQAIYHLSTNYGSSINDSIDLDTFMLLLFHQQCNCDCIGVRKGHFIAKVDLRSDFHLTPVRPEDWNLLGLQWRKQFYINTCCMPFGIKSVPFLFNQLANAMHWSLRYNHSVHHLLHYLDDFFTAGSPTKISL